MVAAITKDLSAIDAAHAEELGRVRREAYRQGVEDAKCKASVDNATSALHKAQLEYAMKRPDWKSEAIGWMSVFNHITNSAFRGARGIARVEIRQRLERLNKEARE